MQLLNKTQIAQKMQRLACEVAEENFDEKEIFVVGVQKRGHYLAKQLAKLLEEKKIFKVNLASVKVNKRDPVADNVKHDLEGTDLKDKVIVLVDDVANTGRTLFYAMKPFMEQLPKSVQVMVLVDRQHKTFPVSADFVGLTLATTLKEHIQLETGAKESVHLT